MRSTLTAGRGAAVFIGVGTLGNLIVSDVDGEFVVPDLIVGLALLIGALLPRGHATSALTAAFGMASGVFAVAAFSYVERGETGPGVTLFALISLAMTVLLAWRVGLPAVNTTGGGAGSGADSVTAGAAGSPHARADVPT